MFRTTRRAGGLCLKPDVCDLKSRAQVRPAPMISARQGGANRRPSGALPQGQAVDRTPCPRTEMSMTPQADRWIHLLRCTTSNRDHAPRHANFEWRIFGHDAAGSLGSHHFEPPGRFSSNAISNSSSRIGYDVPGNSVVPWLGCANTHRLGPTLHLRCEALNERPHS